MYFLDASHSSFLCKPSRSNSGANGSSTTSTSHASSPKNPTLNQQSPNVSSSTKTPLSSAPILSASAPPHFTYPTTSTSAATTQPILQYSTIVSQNTLPTTPTTASSTPSSSSKQQGIVSPQAKQISRQISISNNDALGSITASQTISSAATTASSSTSNSSHLPSLLSNNDRTGTSFVVQAKMNPHMIHSATE